MEVTGRLYTGTFSISLMGVYASSDMVVRVKVSLALHKFLLTLEFTAISLFYINCTWRNVCVPITGWFPAFYVTVSRFLALPLHPGQDDAPGQYNLARRTSPDCRLFIAAL